MNSRIGTPTLDEAKTILKEKDIYWPAFFEGTFGAYLFMCTRVRVKYKHVWYLIYSTASFFNHSNEVYNEQFRKRFFESIEPIRDYYWPFGGKWDEVDPNQEDDGTEPPIEFCKPIVFSIKRCAGVVQW